MLVIKLKGVKKDFSKDPIDYKKIRKEDVYYSKNLKFKNREVSNFKVLNTSITEVKPINGSDNLLIFVHGGAFISGPAKHHWDTIRELSKNTNHTIWLCNYPKAPEHKISEISKNIDEVYKSALENFDHNQITLIGDSVGGTLITALTQRLIQNKIDLPSKIILVSPVMDATMSNTQIEKLDKVDPMLSKAGVLSAKKMCAENNELENVMLSPINGSFVGFPKTILFMGEHDITYPDQQLTAQKMQKANVDVEIVIGESMPHIWPVLPVMKEAKKALNYIIEVLKK